MVYIQAIFVPNFKTKEYTMSKIYNKYECPRPTVDDLDEEFQPVDLTVIKELKDRRREVKLHGGSKEAKATVDAEWKQCWKDTLDKIERQAVNLTGEKDSAFFYTVIQQGFMYSRIRSIDLFKNELRMMFSKAGSKDDAFEDALNAMISNIVYKQAEGFTKLYMEDSDLLWKIEENKLVINMWHPDLLAYRPSEYREGKGNRILEEMKEGDELFTWAETFFRHYICDDRKETYEYYENWSYWNLCYPFTLPTTALNLVGDHGTGKTTFQHIFRDACLNPTCVISAPIPANLSNFASPNMDTAIFNLVKEQSLERQYADVAKQFIDSDDRELNDKYKLKKTIVNVLSLIFSSNPLKAKISEELSGPSNRRIVHTWVNKQINPFLAEGHKLGLLKENRPDWTELGIQVIMTYLHMVADHKWKPQNVVEVVQPACHPAAVNSLFCNVINADENKEAKLDYIKSWMKDYDAETRNKFLKNVLKNTKISKPNIKYFDIGIKQLRGIMIFLTDGNCLEARYENKAYYYQLSKDDKPTEEEILLAEERFEQICQNLDNGIEIEEE